MVNYKIDNKSFECDKNVCFRNLITLLLKKNLKITLLENL